MNGKIGRRNGRVLSGESRADGGGARRAAVLEGMRIVFEKDLTARQRASIEAVFFEGARLTEAAGRMGVSVSAVSRHLKAGVRKLDRAAADAAKIVDAYEKRLAKDGELC